MHIIFNTRVCMLLYVLLQPPPMSSMILRDGNGALYPMAKDFNENVRDPIWLDLAPVTSVSMRVQKLPAFSLVGKDAALVIAFTVKVCSSVTSLAAVSFVYQQCSPFI